METAFSNCLGRVAALFVFSLFTLPQPGKAARPVQILDRSLIASLVSGYEWSLGCWKCSAFGYSRCLVG